MKKQDKKTAPKKSKKNDNSILINSAAGVAIGAAIGGLAGAALSNKKARDVFEDVLTKLAKTAVEGAVKLRNDPENNIPPGEIIVDASVKNSKKK